MSAYDRLPPRVKLTLDEPSWPVTKTRIKQNAIKAKTLRSMNFGDVAELCLFGLEAKSNTPEFDLHMKLINAIDLIESVFSQNIAPNLNQK